MPVPRSVTAELYAVVQRGVQKRTLYLPITERGIDEDAFREREDYDSMQLTWEGLQKQILLSYGPTRNLSRSDPSKYSEYSPSVQRQLSLFDPLTQIASADLLLEGGKGSKAALQTLKRILRIVLEPDRIAPVMPSKGGHVMFEQNGVKVEAIDLPDGFRSTVAWIADLCVTWHETAPKGGSRSTDPADIYGIVLLDEIGLHLHPELERAIVPRLRKALPKVQFVITTHSPMVLASFDKTELIVLDSSEETGVRPPLDRQIFGFSMDEIYEFLMGTNPASTVVEEFIKEGTSEKMAQYIYQSKDVNEDQAIQKLEERRKLLKRLGKRSESI